MKRFLLIILISIPLICNAQELITDLNGFRLGQFREVPKNEFGIILKSDKFEDGFEYDAFLATQDSSVYMIFEYAKSDLNIIWSIQVTGTKNGYDCHFKGLRFGMTSKEIIKILGKPDSIVDIGEYGNRWEYDNTNFSIELNPKGKLSSIKIINKSDEFYPEIDLKKIPSFIQYSNILESRDKKAISEILAPDIEIYKNDSTYYFRNSIENEINNDNSSLFKLIIEMSQIIKQIVPSDSLQYEENVRLVLHQNPMHVAKIHLKNIYSEIVFKWIFGRYLIWEMKIN
jgi:hypothetical protein